MPLELERRIVAAVRRHAGAGALPAAAAMLGLARAEFAAACIEGAMDDGGDRGRLEKAA